MKLKSLSLEHFGPFDNYHIDFPREDHISVLLTGRNNEGKSTIILGLKLIASACRSLWRGAGLWRRR